MNYIERQKKESYKGMSVRQIVSQYEDYMDMAKKCGKHTSDEMVFRPRELKRRHDELVNYMAEQQVQIQADEYSARYPGVEEVMKEIAPKFEYEGEEFLIRVPQRIIDVVVEGRVLHHCGGNSQRYYDRIKEHETYICFLRKKAEPDTPFYTIEVEPGGAIRQHRGMYDEEPELDKVLPFLKEWQKEIKRRMKEEDIERARISSEKREANIIELKNLQGANRKDRVLEGLLKDFMAAV